MYKHLLTFLRFSLTMRHGYLLSCEPGSFFQSLVITCRTRQAIARERSCLLRTKPRQFLCDGFAPNVCPALLQLPPFVEKERTSIKDDMKRERFSRSPVDSGQNEENWLKKYIGELLLYPSLTFFLYQCSVEEALCSARLLVWKGREKKNGNPVRAVNNRRGKYPDKNSFWKKWVRPNLKNVL